MATSSVADDLIEKFRSRQAVVGIIGLGYVGLPLAATFVEGGFAVVGFDVDEAKIGALRKGKSYIRHIPSTRLREVVGWAREIMGGNGILIEHEVIRFFSDAEALYSYEGTAQINNLIVGRGVTGYSAFV